MAIKKTFKIDVDTSQAIKSLDELGGSFEDANGEGAIPLSTTISELEDRLYAMAAAGDTASAEFVEISGQVGKMKKVIIDTDLAVDGLSQTLSQNVGGALQGVAGGFALAQGAMGAFGASGEAVEEAMLKVQSAMAMAQGIQGIREGMASFAALRKAVLANVVVQKLLNFVMSLNPIGLIILAVVALVAAIALLFSPIKALLQMMGLMAESSETAAEANDRLVASMEAVKLAQERLSKVNAKVHDEKMRQLELEDASEKDKHREKLKRLAELEKERLKELGNLETNYDKQVSLYQQSLKEEDFETAKSIHDQLDADKKRIAELRLNGSEYILSKQEEEKGYTAFLQGEDDKRTSDEEAAQKERLSNWKDHLKDRLSAKREIEDLTNKLELDEETQKLDRRKLDFERDIEDVKGNATEKAELKKLIEEQYQRDIIEIKESFIVPDMEILTLKTDNSIEQRNRDFEHANEIRAKEIENAKILAEQQKALDKEVRDSKIQMAQSGFQLVSDIAGLFANRSEKAARIAFNIQKAASIASATISGIEGTINAFKTASASPVTTAFPAYPFIQAGLAGAFAVTNIAKIASSQFQGGGASPASTASGGGGGGGNIANFNVVGETGINQLADSLGSQETVVKAFVVSTEVTTAQGLDRSKIDTATL